MTAVARFESLVVDTTPLLKGAISSTLAEHLYTVPEVLGELRDEATRERVGTVLLHTIVTKEPSPEALRITLEAAKRTGDIASLSKTDLKLAALCVTLDMEAEPGRDYSVEDMLTIVGEGKRKTETKETGGNRKKDNDTEGTAGDQRPLDGEWITPNTIREQSRAADRVRLACVSGDCSIQNLLLSMRLPAYNADLKRVYNTKSFLLRCHACGWTTAPTTLSQFCGECGSPTLLRTTYTIDGSGQRRLWLRSHYEYNLRGTKYSLPRPQGGRGGDLVLRADQREYGRALERLKTQHSKAISLDDIDDRLAAVFGDMSMKQQKGRRSQQAGHAVIGHGRSNPNQARRK